MWSGIAALLPYAAGARGRLVAAAGLAVGAAACELVPYLAVSRVLAELVVGPAPAAGSVLAWAGLAMAGIAGRHVLFGAAMFVSHLAAYDVLRNLRARLAERLAGVPLGWWSERRSGAVKKVLVDDVERLEVFLAHALPDLAAAAAVGTATTVWLLARDWQAGLAVVVTVPVAFACMAVSLHRAGERVGGYHRSLGAMNAAVVEHLRALPVLKVFGRDDAGAPEAERAVRAHARAVGDMTRRFLPLGTAYYSLVVAGMTVLAPAGAALAHSGSLDASDLAFFAVVGIGYGQPIARLYATWSQLAQMSFGAGLVDEVLGAATFPERPRQGLGPPAVEFTGVGFAYQDGPEVLHDVSFRAEPGTITALVGPSGGGKTTIARLVARFADAGTGAVRVGGVDVREMAVEQLMETVAFVFQEPFLFDDTVEANLAPARPGATGDELRAAARAAGVLDTIEALPEGWATRVGGRGTHLSGGERQRLALARALVKDAPVVVLDEATAFVDPENEARVRDAIAALAAGRTVLMIAHRLSSVVDADQVLVVDDGRIVERGRHDDLVTAGGLYARLWDDFTTGDSLPLAPPVDPAATYPPAAAVERLADPTPHPPPADEGAYPQGAGTGALGRVWRLAGPRRRALGLACAARLGWALAVAVAVHELALVVVAAGAGTLDGGHVARATAVSAGCLAAQVGLNYASNRLAWVAAFDVGAEVRIRLLAHLRRLPLGFHAGRDQGDALTAVTQDVTAAETFAHAPLPNLVGAVAAPLVVVAAIAVLDWRLGLVAVAPIVGAVPVYRRARRAFAGLAARRQQAQAAAGGRVVEYVQGIAVVRAFNLGGDRLAAFTAALDELRAVNTRLAVAILPLAATAMVVVEAGLPLVVAAGALWHGPEAATTGAAATAATTGPVAATGAAATLAVALVLALRAHQPLAQAADQLEVLRIADASLQRVAGVLDAPPQAAPSRPLAVPADASVHVTGLSFGYDPDRPVLHDLELDIPAGTTCALVGPSGAGKSTLTHLVARFRDPDAGAVRIGGVDLRLLTVDQLRATITMVFQDVYLLPGTIRDNVTLARPDASPAELGTAARRSGLDDVVASLPRGWDTPVGEGGARLSGGQRQRVSLARAFLKDAPVVLLDEATAALDPSTERRVRAGLAELARGRTVLVVAHRLATVRHADQVVVLDAGRIVERGRHDDLMAAGGRYARLFAERQRAARWRVTASSPRSPEPPVPM